MTGDPTLFRLRGTTVDRLTMRPMPDELALQHLIESHLRQFLGVCLLATEYPTGSRHGGRIDTLDIDDRATPVIIEYKRRTATNLINQSLFYLDWLDDHRAEFSLLLLDRLGGAAPSRVNWLAPGLICVAPRFHRYDLHAIRHIRRQIELVRYRWFGPDLFLLEEVARANLRV